MLDRNPMKRSPGSSREGDRQVRTVCQECSVGCGIVAHVEGPSIVDVQGDEDHPVNRGRLCARGTAFAQGLTYPDRIVTPAVRKKGSFQPLEDWKTAMDLLADKVAVDAGTTDNLQRAALIEDGENYMLTMRLGVIAQQLYAEGWARH